MRPDLGPREAQISAAIFSIEGRDFCIQPLPKTRLASISNETSPSTLSSCLLATVINWDDKRFTSNDLELIADKFAACDDVWIPSFLEVIILRASDTLLVELENNRVKVYVDSTPGDLPNGPYIVQPSSGDIWALCRLFHDEYLAFIGGSVAHDAATKTFTWLPTGDKIAVPSRLYYEHTIEKPLAGHRFAVKDVIDIAGLETGCGSRCYRSLYPKSESSAPCVQQLINAGAVLVGKTKTTQFADGQEPSEWFDYIAPFNPRGDGYQKPSSSSTGSAVACAGYGWLDFTIGTDTGGSIRHPAGINGIYGIRPSLHSVASQGFCVSPFFDTPGVFARNVAILEGVGRAMVAPSYTLQPPPKLETSYKLLYPINDGENGPQCWFPRPGTPGKSIDAEVQFEMIIQKVEQHLNCTRQMFSIGKLWKETHPEGQSDSLAEATSTLYQNIVYYNYIRETIDPFIADYQAAHDGRKPFFEPVLSARHEYGRQITAMQNAEALKSMKMFSTWILDILLAASDQDQIPLLIFPQSWGCPDYRDRYPASDSQLFWNGFSRFAISYCSGCPDYTVPVGELPYHSRITGREEWLPLSLSVLGRPGTDLNLLALLRELEDVGILRPPGVGTRMYSPVSPTQASVGAIDSNEIERLPLDTDNTRYRDNEA